MLDVINAILKCLWCTMCKTYQTCVNSDIKQTILLIKRSRPQQTTKIYLLSLQQL